MTVYDQHNATFRNVSAYVVMKGARRVGTVAFKNGTGCQVFAHWIGSTMIRATAGGGGYDRHSSACAKAARKASHNGDVDAKAFWAALAIDGGSDWSRELERAGFAVFQAV